MRLTRLTGGLGQYWGGGVEPWALFRFGGVDQPTPACGAGG
jgi:hypothetical protein